MGSGVTGSRVLVTGGHGSVGSGHGRSRAVGFWSRAVRGLSARDSARAAPGVYTGNRRGGMKIKHPVNNGDDDDGGGGCDDGDDDDDDDNNKNRIIATVIRAGGMACTGLPLSTLLLPCVRL